MKSSYERCSASRILPRCSSTSGAGNRSWPAATGVWVVKTVIAETSRTTSPNGSPLASTCRRIISSVAKALWPSLRCSTDGLISRRVQGPDPADAQEQLLADPDPGVAAVEPRRQRAVRLAVLRDVRVEQQQRRPADLHPPDPRVQHAGGGLDRDQERLAVGAGHALDRQQLEVGVEIVLLLPAVGVERLAEVALGVQQADADQRDAQVAGALEVVAGQHAQAARVDRQALVQAELGREVRHRPGPQDRGVDRPPAIGVLEVLGQPAEGVVDPRVERHLRRPPLELVDRQPLEELDRIVVDLPPERGVQLAEQAR